jgi:hypothetical protein
VGAGTGDTIAGGNEVTGVVQSDAGGVPVQPGITRKNASTREILRVFMDKVDMDICYTCFNSSLFSTCLIIFISYLKHLQIHQPVGCNGLSLTITPLFSRMLPAFFIPFRNVIMPEKRISPVPLLPLGIQPDAQ